MIRQDQEFKFATNNSSSSFSSCGSTDGYDRRNNNNKNNNPELFSSSRYCRRVSSNQNKSSNHNGTMMMMHRRQSYLALSLDFQEDINLFKRNSHSFHSSSSSSSSIPRVVSSRFCADLALAFNYDISRISSSSVSHDSNFASIEGIVRHPVWYVRGRPSSSASLGRCCCWELDTPKYLLYEFGTSVIHDQIIIDSIFAVRIAREIGSAVRRLHQNKNFVVGSICLENVFLSSDDDESSLLLRSRRQREEENNNNNINTSNDDDDFERRKRTGRIILTNYGLNETEKVLNHIRVTGRIEMEGFIRGIATAANNSYFYEASMTEIRWFKERFTFSQPSYKKIGKFAAPEMSFSNSSSKEIDKWDFGVLCFELLEIVLRRRCGSLNFLSDLKKYLANLKNVGHDVEFTSNTKNLTQENVDEVLKKLKAEIGKEQNNDERRMLGILFGYVESCLLVDPEQRSIMVEEAENNENNNNQHQRNAG